MVTRDRGNRLPGKLTPTSRSTGKEDAVGDGLDESGVSVVTLVSGRSEKWLEDAKRSVLEQESQHPIEHILVENHDRRWTLGAGYNEGIRRSRYRWVAILDDDDELHPSAIEYLLGVMYKAKSENEKVWQSTCHQLFIDENGEPLGTTDSPPQGLLDKKIVLELGGFPSIPWEAYKDDSLIHSDTRLAVSAAVKGFRQAHVKQTLYAMRLHKQKASSNLTGKGAFFDSIIENARKGIIKHYAVQDNPNAGVIFNEENLKTWELACRYQEQWRWSKDGVLIHTGDVPDEVPRV